MGSKKQLPLILRNKEQTFRLSELAPMLPDEPCYSTVLNWCRKGIPADGTVIYMEKINSPTGHRSSIEAYYRFLVNLNGGELCDESA